MSVTLIFLKHLYKENEKHGNIYSEKVIFYFYYRI